MRDPVHHRMVSAGHVLKKMTSNELRKKFPNAPESFIRANATDILNFPHAIESFKRLNPHLVGGLSAPEPKRDGRQPIAPSNAAQKGGAGRVVVSLVGLRRRELDDDNFVGACKHLRDAIAASLGMDDGDPRLRWEYSQQETRGAEGVAVVISRI